VYHWFNPRRQQTHCIDHERTEVVLYLPLHCPCKGFTHLNAGQPEVDIVGFVAREILHPLAHC
jgi:hypothetical protein